MDGLFALILIISVNLWYVVAEKNVCLCSRTRILTDSARKRNRKEVLRIIIKKELQ
jgi:hypothetical protein